MEIRVLDVRWYVPKRTAFLGQFRVFRDKLILIVIICCLEFPLTAYPFIYIL